MGVVDKTCGSNCIEVNGKAGPVVSTVLALPMPPWKRCSKFLEH